MSENYESSKLHSKRCCVCYDSIHGRDTHVHCMQCIARICEDCETQMLKHNAMFVCPLCRHHKHIIEVGDHVFDGITIDLTDE